MRPAVSVLRDLIYPRRCVLCRRAVGPAGERLCPACAAGLPAPLSGALRGSHYKRWVSALWYEDPFRASFHRFKFGGCRFYAQVYAPWLARAIQAQYAGAWDVLTYVPISRLRRWRRGYDQTRLLADAVGARLGCAPIPTLRKRHKPAQSRQLRREDRQHNIRGAFRILDPEAVRGKRILLLDDVLTTGATVSEAARVLKEAGAKTVLVATLAVTPR